MAIEPVLPFERNGEGEKERERARGRVVGGNGERASKSEKGRGKDAAHRRVTGRHHGRWREAAASIHPTAAPPSSTGTTTSIDAANFRSVHVRSTRPIRSTSCKLVQPSRFTERSAELPDRVKGPSIRLWQRSRADPAILLRAPPIGYVSRLSRSPSSRRFGGRSGPVESRRSSNIRFLLFNENQSDGHR